MLSPVHQLESFQMLNNAIFQERFQCLADDRCETDWAVVSCNAFYELYITCSLRLSQTLEHLPKIRENTFLQECQRRKRILNSCLKDYFSDPRTSQGNCWYLHAAEPSFLFANHFIAQS
jgi:hypothetical protein